MRIKNWDCRFVPDRDLNIVNNESDPRFAEYRREYCQLTKRRGVDSGAGPAVAHYHQPDSVSVPSRCTVVKADGMICGAWSGDYHDHFTGCGKNALAGFHEGVHTAGQ